MKTNPKTFFTTDLADSADGIPSVPYPCPPCHPRLNPFVAQFIILIVLGLMNDSASAQIQQAWVTRYDNGMANGTNQAVKMALDSSNNIIVTGFSQNTNNNLGYIAIKYAPSGSQLWATRFDSTNYPEAAPTSMAVDHSNNVIVTGYGVTVKYATNGVQLWTAPYGATSAPVKVDDSDSLMATAAVAVDAGDNVYVTGFGTNFNTEKLSPNGSNLWAVSYRDVGPTISQTVLVDSQTNIYVAGSDAWLYYGDPGGARLSSSQLLVRKYDSAGDFLWSANYGAGGDEGPFSISGSALDSANNCYLLFNTYNFPFTTTMFSNNGVLAWGAGDPTGDGFSLGGSLALDKMNDVLITGRNSYDYPASQYGTYKLSTNGGIVWGLLYPNAPTALNSATSVVVDNANNSYVTGFSPGTNSINNIVTLKYDNNGNQLWLQTYCSPSGGNAAADAIAVDANGNVYVAGYDTTAAGGTEMVLIKYAPTLSGTVQGNGSFLLQTTGEPGETVDVQATTNFTNWLDLGLTNADTNGHLQFLDTNAPNYPARFYLTTPQ